MKHDEAAIFLKECINTPWDGLCTQMTEKGQASINLKRGFTDALCSLMYAYEALIRDWSEAVQNAEDIMACNACVHCVVETDDMLCGRAGYGCKPQWRGPEPGGL